MAKNSAASALVAGTSAVERELTADKNERAAGDRLLERIHGRLRALEGNVPLLKSRGVDEDGWLLVDYVTSWPCHSYYIVQFTCIGPDGPKRLDDGTLVLGHYFMKFPMHGAARKGCILLVVVNRTHFVFVRQHRAPGLVAMGKPFLTEAARGFPTPVKVETMLEGKVARSGLKLDAAAERTLHSPREGEVAEATSHPLGILGKELRPLGAHRAVQVVSLERLSDDVGVFEDSGMSVAANEFWCLNLEASIEDVKGIRGSRKFGIRMHAIEDVLIDPSKLDIHDAHTLTAVQLYTSKLLREQPRHLMDLYRKARRKLAGSR